MAESIVRTPDAWVMDRDFLTTLKLKPEKVIDEGICGEIVLAISLEQKDVRRVVKKFCMLKQENMARNNKLFHAEIRCMQSFDHPFIMKCFIAGRCPEYMAHCTLYYHSGTLDNYLGLIVQEVAEHLVTQIACALRYMHNHNVVHLDVKLNNIFLDSDFNAILGDFGHAVVLYPHQKTLPKGQCGYTPTYLPPERIAAANDTELDPYKMDSYCLGVVFWALIMGIDAAEGIDYYLETRRNRNLPKYLWIWLQKLLNRNPSKRLTVTDFLTLLRREGGYPSVIDNN